MVTWTIARFTLAGLLRDRALLALVFVLPVAVLSVADTLLPSGQVSGAPPPLLAVAAHEHPWAVYAVGALAALVLLILAARGAAFLLAEEDCGVGRRLRLAPVTEGALLAGRVIALYGVALAGLLVLFLWGQLAFDPDLDLAGRFLPLIALAAGAAACGTGMGFLLAGIVPSRRALSTIALVIIVVMSLLGGSLVPPAFLPSWLEWLGTFTPNRLLIWGTGALFGRSDRTWGAAPHALLLALSGLIALAVGLLLIAARGREGGLRRRRGR